MPLATGTKSFHHTKKQPPKSTTVAYKAYFAAKFEFSTKPEVVFEIFINGDRFSLAILQKTLYANFRVSIVFGSIYRRFHI